MPDRPAADRRVGKRHLALAALGWTTFAVYGSLVPLRYQPTDLADAIERFRHLPPLGVGMGTRADWVANILLFIPLTFLWMGAVTFDRGRIARIGAALAIVPLAMTAAVLLEFTQIWFPGRTVGMNDIVAESIGGTIGVLAWLAAGQRFMSWLGTYAGRGGPRSQLEWLLQAYLFGFIVWSVIPLDLTISLTELYHKYRRGQVMLVPFAYTYDSPAALLYQFFADIAVFVPVGAWVARLGRGEAPAPSIGRAVIGGAVIAAAIEFAQLLVLSRYTDTTDVVLGTIGAAIGGALVVRRAGGRHHAPVHTTSASILRAAMPWLAAIAAYSAFLAAGFLFPFEVVRERAMIEPRIEAFFRVPFLSLYRGSEFNAIQQVLVRLLLFAPLGAMWAQVAHLARSASAERLLVIAGLAYSAGAALGIEAVQILMPSKVADATDVVLCTAGAAGGLFICRRLLQTPPSGSPP